MVKCLGFALKHILPCKNVHFVLKCNKPIVFMYSEPLTLSHIAVYKYIFTVIFAYTSPIIQAVSTLK